jgi:hypothetical protein
MLLAAVLLIQLSACTRQSGQQFSVVQDTLHINAPDYFTPYTRIELQWSVPYQDWYFCIFEENDIYEPWRNQYVFLAISKDGKNIRKLDCPKEFNLHTSGDLYVRQDNLFLYIPYDLFDPRYYCFDLKQWKWKPAKGESNLLYEDDAYQIAAVNMGEWGSYTWFIDKQRNNDEMRNIHTQYVRPYVVSERVIRLDSIYYFVHPYGIYITSVKGPKGVLCDDSTSYRIGEERDYRFIGGLFYWPILNETGIKVDSFPSYFHFTGKKVVGNDSWKESTVTRYDSITQYDTVINQAFLSNNQLYCIVTTPKNSFISQIRDGKMIPELDLGERYDFSRHRGSFRSVNLADNKCFLQFEKDFSTYGLMDVEDRTIRIRHLVIHQDTLPFVGTDNVKPLLEFLLMRLGNLSLDELRRYETQLGGICYQKYRDPNGYFPDEYQNKDKYFSPTFYKRVNGQQTFVTEYCVSMSDSMVKKVFMEWVKTNFFNSHLYGYKTCDNLAAKCAEVSEIVSKITGTKPKREKNYLKWTFNGLTIKLYEKDGRMVIC